MSSKNKLKSLIDKKASDEEILKFYDTLDIVELDMMNGVWRGSEIPSNHPMYGALENFNWYGKEFEDEDNVHPLLFENKKGDIYKISPSKLLIGTDLNIALSRNKIVQKIFPIFKGIFKTKKSQARIRMVKYRGKLSAAMLYDRVPIIDVFRKIDENTVIGVMDFKGPLKEKGYFFILERVNVKKGA